MNLRVLLVEGESEEALFLKDVLSEIQERRDFRPWVGLDVLFAETCEDAEAILATETLDVVLLNPDLPDRQGLPAYHYLQSAAPAVPFVLLLGIGDDSLGLRLVREGAQDYLIRKQVDCEPLAHALRNAVERQKPTSASQATHLRDALTGLPTVGCFSLFAARDRQLAEQFACRWMIALVEPRDIEILTNSPAEQRRDLRLVETADLLSHCAASGDSVYRIGLSRFALTRFETDRESLQSSTDRLLRALPRERVKIGTAVFYPENPAELETLLLEAQDDLVSPALRRAPTSLGLARAVGAA